MDVFVLLSVVVLSIIPLTDGKKVEGTISTTNTDWEFIARFCFLAKKGTMKYVFEFPKSYGVQNLLMYYDEDDQWNSVYKSSKNCEQKIAVLDPAAGQVVSLSVLYAWSGCQEITRDGKEYIRCEGGRVFRATRERWWFIAVSRCDQSSGPKGVYIDYELHMTNSKDEKDFLRLEYSADEFYIFPVDVTFVGLYLLLTTGAIICAVILRSRQLFHTTYKMYVVAVILYLINRVFSSLAYGLLGSSGWEHPTLKLIGRMFGAASDLVFLLMLILVGKGYTITRGRLPTASTVKVAVFFTLYSLCFIIVFIYEAKVFDPGEVLYLYESPAGYGLIALRLIGWGWFCYSVFFTVKHYKNKSLFYYPFFIFYTIWFWCSPILVICAMLEVPLWMREKVVHGVELFVYFAGHFFFQILTRPQAANKNFPYHVRTTQIACMTGTNSHELDNFKNHAYDVSSDFIGSGAPDLTNLFTTSWTSSSSKDEKEKGEIDDFFVTPQTSKRASLPPSYSAAQLMQRSDSQDGPPSSFRAASMRRATIAGPSNPNSLFEEEPDPLPGASAFAQHRASVSLPPRASDMPTNRPSLPPITSSQSSTNLTRPPSYKALFTVGE